jgi:hypothetical protein
MRDFGAVLEALRSEDAGRGGGGGGAAGGGAGPGHDDDRVPPDVTDPRYFVWDVETGAFRPAAARRLLAAIGVVKPAQSTLLPAGDFVAPARAIPAASAAAAAGRGAAIAIRKLTAAGDINGGGTGREHLRNLLLDGTEPWNKWLHPHASSSWVQAELESPAVLARYALCSANDCPERDPARWRLLGRRAADGVWGELHAVPSCPFVGRWQWVSFDCVPGPTCDAVRLEIAAVRSPGQGVQLGHWRLAAEA